MSHEEDLIDYSDEELQTTAAPTTTAAPAASNGDAAKEGDLTVSGGRPDKKGSYVGIHKRHGVLPVLVCDRYFFVRRLRSIRGLN